MAWPPTEKDVDRVRFLRQMEHSLREEARRKKMKIQELEKQNAFARYVLQFFEEENSVKR